MLFLTNQKAKHLYNFATLIGRSFFFLFIGVSMQWVEAEISICKFSHLTLITNIEYGEWLLFISVKIRVKLRGCPNLVQGV